MRFCRAFFPPILFAAALACMGCNYKPHANDTRPLDHSDKTSPTASNSPAGIGSKDNAGISYAKNPERFVKEPVVEPPFNLTDPRTATDFFDVGVHEDNLKHYDKAITAYEKALTLKPDWSLLCLREAKDYKRLGKQGDAIAQLKHATKIDSHYWDAYSELALTYKDMGDTRHAIEAASKMLDFPPLQIPVHNQLAYWYEEIGEKQKARREFETYRDLAKKTPSEPRTDRYQTAMAELKKLTP